MGFDIECIIDIHTYPGEYFCPVCRTLVYPNEAFQSQCTHLYCKHCLPHIANGSKACPYDGYLVTESESKPLVDSDKTLAENIGKVKVHCLFFRSGCPWEGTLSDCTSHCSVCSFGNSPVICNRCGIQIVHRQVNDHAQSCSGVYEGQHAVGGDSSSTRPVAIPSGTEVNQAAAQSGTPSSQAQNPQNVTATPLPGQNPNMQMSAPSQAPVVAPVALTTPEQWYQQQYQQYYQQNGAYDPYQQSNQQYYSIQQQPFQQYQQHPVQVQGQQQTHPHSQPQQQSNPVPQAPQQHHFPQGQGQSQSLPQTTQPQLLPQAQPEVSVPPQGQAHLHAPTQGIVPNYQVGSQQQSYPPMRPQTQVPPQTLPPPPQSQPTQPQPYGQAMSVRPPAQHPQVPQYQQPQLQVHHPRPSQANVQPQMQSQALQSSNQLHVQIQPQQSQPYHTLSQPPVFPQSNQSVPAALPQAPQQPVPPVSGHQSYLHPQPPQKMHPGTSQRHLMHPQIASGSLHPVQVHGQVPQQHQLMRPPSQGSVPHQHPTLLAPHNQVPVNTPAPHQQFLTHAPQPAYQQHHHPVVPPSQPALPQNYAHQQHYLAPSQSQLHQQMRPQGPPLDQQTQNFAARPVISNQGIHSQSHPLPTGNSGPPAHPVTAQLTSAQTSVSQNYPKPTSLEKYDTVQETKSPSKDLVEKIGEPLNEKEVVAGQNGTVVKDAKSDASVDKSIIKQDGNGVQNADEKSFEEGAAEDEFRKEGKFLADSDSLNQVDNENQKLTLSNTVITGPSSTNFDKQSHTDVSASGAEGHTLPPHSHQQRPQVQAPGQPPSMLGPQGPGILPHPGSLNSTEERAPGYFGPPKGFESQPSSHGPALTTHSDPRGIMGRAPPPRFEGQHGPQHFGRSSDVLASNNQMSSSAHLSGEALPLRMNGLEAADPSIPSSWDEKKALSKEPIHILDQASKFDPATGPHSRSFQHHPSVAHGHADVYGPGPEFGQHQMMHFSRRSPGRDYLGSSPRRFGGPSSYPRGTSTFDDYKSREAHRFGQGSQPFNHPSDVAGNPFNDGRYLVMPDHLRGGDHDGPRNPRFGEHMGPGPHNNQIGSDDAFRPDRPGHEMRGKFSGPGYLPGHIHMTDPAGPGAFYGREHAAGFGGPGNFPCPPFSEFDRSSFSQFGEPPMPNYSSHGFQTRGGLSGGMDSFDQSRKRKPVSYGWCRICGIDCGSVEGLDMHSQTREHQKMAMDIVKSIKTQNKRQQR
ncbi:hypothetical protein CASFOL_032956 [Castilleja foliolosa]|uniref:RING-type domain-containing protein n=1 Tax=Castilleja foliolosa TaxID=1961234 RepID=A0ABD3C2Z9_9LAMI